MAWLKISEEKSNKYINIEDLEVSFNQDFYDYVIYDPIDPTKYITYIYGYRLGFGPRYLLLKILDHIKQIFKDKIPIEEIKSRPIPKLSEPIIRRLGRKNILEEIIRKERKKWLRFEPSPRGWEEIQNVSTEGTNVYKNINRPEERWWY